MSSVNKYLENLELNLKKLRKYADFEKSDPSAKAAMDIGRSIVTAAKKDNTPAQWYLHTAAALTGYLFYLGTKEAESASEAQVADITFKNVRDGLVLALTGDGKQSTVAKAMASSDLVDAQLDVEARMQNANYYKAINGAAEKLISVSQSIARNKDNELNKVKIADRGRQ